MPLKSPGHKQCPKCLIQKPLAAFYRTIGTSDGRTEVCRDCIDAADPAFAREAQPFEPESEWAGTGRPSAGTDARAVRGVRRPQAQEPLPSTHRAHRKPQSALPRRPVTARSSVQTGSPRRRAKPPRRKPRRIGPLKGGRECYPPQFIRDLIRHASRRETPWIETCSVFGCYEPAERHHISYAHPHLFIWLCRTHHEIWHQTVRAMFREYLESICIFLPPDVFINGALSALQHPPL